MYGYSRSEWRRGGGGSSCVSIVVHKPYKRVVIVSSFDCSALSSRMGKVVMNSDKVGMRPPGLSFAVHM